MSHEIDHSDPYIEKPDELNDTEDGAVCFLDPGNVCGAHCTAWRTFPVGTPGEMSDKQQHCLLLSSIHILGKHVAIIAEILLSGQREKKNAAADEARARELRELEKDAG
jgi:hypothetical protein